MQPRDLKADQFSGYPPQARALVVANLATLQQLPPGLLPSLLREVIDYDYKFPAERTAIDQEFATLHGLSPEEKQEWFSPFAHLSLSEKLQQADWINQPAQFTEQLSAYLWSTSQMDAFRAAATDYGNRLQRAIKSQPLPAPRLGIAVIGQGVPAYSAPLFRKLRPHGTYFSHIKPDQGLSLLMAAVAARAQAHPVPYAHWYIDGGEPAEHPAPLTTVSYQGLAPLRTALLKYIQAQLAKAGMGPEELRTHLAQLSPLDLGMDPAGDAVLDRFQLRLFNEGSGTQIYSTTFAQWTTREALRRAQPLTVFVRFAPRQRQRPMNELLSDTSKAVELDPVGSLLDADMAAWYHWINQQRLSGAESSSFIVWYEDQNQALAIGPTLPRGVESHSSLNLSELLRLAVGTSLSS